YGSKVVASNQKPPLCAELVPPSPDGTNEGGAKCAAVLVIGGSDGAYSEMTPSLGDEAQAESRHPMSKELIPNKAACFFTKAKVPITQPDATLPSSKCD